MGGGGGNGVGGGVGGGGQPHLLENHKWLKVYLEILVRTDRLPFSNEVHTTLWEIH